MIQLIIKSIYVEHRDMEAIRVVSIRQMHQLLYRLTNFDDIVSQTSWTCNVKLSEVPQRKLFPFHRRSEVYG